jgi:prepilin-type processing-associated H-X9-DG protein
VLIGIIVLLMALLLPAIQKVRETANLMICASNLKELGLAAHDFHADYGRLPPGYLGPSLKNNANLPALYFEGQWIGHLPLVLPYLEHDAIFKQIRANFSVAVVSEDKWWWSAPANGPGPPNVQNYAAAMNQLRNFRCPSANDFVVPVGNSAPTGGGTLVGLHVFNNPAISVFTTAWKDEYGSATPYRPLGRTNYVGVAGTGSGTHPFYSQFEGIYINRSVNTLGQVTSRDGTSNTLLYGETCGSHWNGIQDICWMAAGSLGTYLGLQRGRSASTIAFSSYHAAGVHFCFADGSVRIVRFGDTLWDQASAFPSDWLLLQQLAGWRDGGPTDSTALVE